MEMKFILFVFLGTLCTVIFKFCCHFRFGKPLMVLYSLMVFMLFPDVLIAVNLPASSYSDDFSMHMYTNDDVYGVEDTYDSFGEYPNVVDASYYAGQDSYGITLYADDNCAYEVMGDPKTEVEKMPKHSFILGSLYIMMHFWECDARCGYENESCDAWLDEFWAILRGKPDYDPTDDPESPTQPVQVPLQTDLSLVALLTYIYFVFVRFKNRRKQITNFLKEKELFAMD